MFGSEGRGDINDDWIIECTDEAQDFLKGATVFALKHAETGKYLYTDNKYTYNQENCRNCPIIGQREVFATFSKNRYCDWKVVGVLFESFFCGKRRQLRKREAKTTHTRIGNILSNR